MFAAVDPALPRWELFHADARWGIHVENEKCTAINHVELVIG